MTPPSRVHASASTEPASEGAARVATAKKPARKTAARSTKRGAADKDSIALVENSTTAPTADVAEPDVLETDAPLEELVEEVIDVEAEVLVDVESDEVVVTVGKKRTLDDVDESTFEPADEAKLEDELTEDQGFTLSEADDADEPEQQVMVGRCDRRPGQGLPEADRQGRRC